MLLHYAAIICMRWLTFASSIRHRVQRGLIILKYQIFYAADNKIAG